MYTKIRMVSRDHLVGLVKCLMDANACSDNVMLAGIEECVIHIDQTARHR